MKLGYDVGLLARALRRSDLDAWLTDVCKPLTDEELERAIKDIEKRAFDLENKIKEE